MGSCIECSGLPGKTAVTRYFALSWGSFADRLRPTRHEFMHLHAESLGYSSDIRWCDNARSEPYRRRFDRSFLSRNSARTKSSPKEFPKCAQMVPAGFNTTLDRSAIWSKGRQLHPYVKGKQHNGASIVTYACLPSNFDAQLVVARVQVMLDAAHKPVPRTSWPPSIYSR
jgi:hypothetical protein